MWLCELLRVEVRCALSLIDRNPVLCLNDAHHFIFAVARSDMLCVAWFALEAARQLHHTLVVVTQGGSLTLWCWLLLCADTLSCIDGCSHRTVHALGCSSWLAHCIRSTGALGQDAATLVNMMGSWERHCSWVHLWRLSGMSLVIVDVCNCA